MTMNDKNEPLSWRPDMTAADYIILLGGIISTAVVMVLAQLLLRKNFCLISLMTWGILPMGAVALGIGSALGFLVAARLKQKKMSALAAVLMIFILIPAYFGHYYLVYSSLKIESEAGEVVPLSQEVNFWQIGRASCRERV